MEDSACIIFESWIILELIDLFIVRAVANYQIIAKQYCTKKGNRLIPNSLYFIYYLWVSHSGFDFGFGFSFSEIIFIGAERSAGRIEEVDTSTHHENTDEHSALECVSHLHTWLWSVINSLRSLLISHTIPLLSRLSSDENAVSFPSAIKARNH